MKLRTKFFVVLLVFFIGLSIYLLILISSSKQAPALNEPPVPSPTVDQQANSAVNTTPTVQPRVTTITYTDQRFSPESVSIRKGDTIKFVNNSSEPLWVGSSPHPTHTGYPTTGGCINSTFDSCLGIQPGDSWSFTFEIAGTWGYHNHLRARERGTVIVKD